MISQIKIFHTIYQHINSCYLIKSLILLHTLRVKTTMTILQIGKLALDYKFAYTFLNQAYFPLNYIRFKRNSTLIQ